MALNARLLGRSLLSCHGLRPIYGSATRCVTIQHQPAEIPPEEGHDERNMRLCRPQSPHITIYRFPLPAILSITHRFTGMILSGYAATFAAASVISDQPMCELLNTISSTYPNCFLVFKFGLIFPFTYHFFNGIRHLVWDNAKALSLKGVYASGYMMLLAAGLSGLALFIIWDTGKALSMKAVYITGYLMLLCTAASCGGLVYLNEIEGKRTCDPKKGKGSILKDKPKKKKT